MPPPVTQVNNLVKQKISDFDRTSKIFILTELIFGLNRVPVFSNTKPIFLILSFILSISINITVIYCICYDFSYDIFKFLDLLKLTQYLVCVILAFAFRKRLSNFYAELRAFDSETDFGGEMRDITKNVVQSCLTVGFTLIAYIIFKSSSLLEVFEFDDMIILLIHIGELHFFGHLLSLLIPRLRFIRRLMKSSFHDSGINTIEKEILFVKNKKQSYDIRKLMDFYHRIIVAFDTLNDAIKWQMLFILITTFTSTLSLSYIITLQLIRNEYEVSNVLLVLTLTFIEMVPMFAPCRVVDAVHGEASCLIELLSSKLYENKIDKSSRTVAQALLALMQAKDLSWSLLRIFDIDISFPFKFLGLLVTYLIILLQFEKVINLDRTIT